MICCTYEIKFADRDGLKERYNQYCCNMGYNNCPHAPEKYRDKPKKPEKYLCRQEGFTKFIDQICRGWV